MAVLHVTLPDGSARVINEHDDKSVMMVIRDNGIDDMLALCGGSLSCATCHVYVDEGQLNSLPAMQPSEADLLEAIASRRPTSRLSCQILFSAGLDGLTGC